MQQPPVRLVRQLLGEFRLLSRNVCITPHLGRMVEGAAKEASG
jgi:hypothetical protein